jgi:biotin synthase
MSTENTNTRTCQLEVSELLITGEARTDWELSDVEALFNLPLNDLLYAAQWVHRKNFDANTVQISTLLSIKTGGCPEDCAYCPQSIRYDTNVETENLMSLDEVRLAAREAKAAGATRFCMGAAYRGPKNRQVEKISQMITEIKAMGMETCATLGLLTQTQAEQLACAGLDFYNHNLDTSESYYPKIITTRSFSDRLETLEHVRAAGMKVCCGGIIGMGENRSDRVSLLHTLSTLVPQPESVPINQLVPIPGTPLAEKGCVDGLEFARTIGVARILMPRSHVRLSAGRGEFTDELQALCFAAGANSIFYGDILLTTENPEHEADQALFSKLGLKPEPAKNVS